MPECQHCGAFVTEHYVRVFSVGGEIHCCPECPDRVRRNGDVQRARAKRRNGRTERGRSSYDPVITDGGSQYE